MIKEFNKAEVAPEGLVNKFILDEIKVVYPTYPELAMELAISALEYSLTGQISSDDYWIKGKIMQYKKHLEEDK